MEASTPSAECSNCGILRQQLEVQLSRNKELEDVNERLSQELQTLMQTAGSLKDPEIELKKGIFASMTESSISDDAPSGTQGLKKVQQELRVSKKAEQLAKEKLALTKRSLEKVEKDFAKYREDSESRIETLKTEISVLQKHYDQLQNSGNDLAESLGVEKFLPFNLGGMNSSLSERHTSQQTAADLLKIIDDYSKQTEAKSKEIEVLTSKLDKKQAKLSDLKKKYGDSETRVSKLKNTLDNVKTFLKVLNSNFIKSMKSQNALLKDQITQSERDMNKDIEAFKLSIGPQIAKLVIKKERDLLSKLQSEKSKTFEIQQKIESLKSDHESHLFNLKQDHEQALLKQKEQLKGKIHTLKAQLKQFSEEQASKTESKDNLNEQLSAQITILEKQIQVLELQLSSEKDKHNLVTSDLQKDLTAKSSIIEEFRSKEFAMSKKLEDQEARSREEIAKLFEKLEKASAGSLDKQLTSQLLSQREALLTQDFNSQREAQARLYAQMESMYELKLKDKEADLEKLRLEMHQIRQENATSKEEALQLKTNVADLNQKVDQKDSLLAYQKQQFEDQIRVNSKQNLDQLAYYQEKFDQLKKEKDLIEQEFLIKEQSGLERSKKEEARFMSLIEDLRAQISISGAKNQYQIQSYESKLLALTQELDQARFNQSLDAIQVQVDLDTSSLSSNPLPKKKKKTAKAKAVLLSLDEVPDQQRYEDSDQLQQPLQTEIKETPALPVISEEFERPVNNTNACSQEEQANQQDSRNGSSSRGSSYEQQFEGGEGEKKEENPPQMIQGAPSPFRPPMQMRPPGVGPFQARGRGIPTPFRAPGPGVQRPRPVPQTQTPQFRAMPPEQNVKNIEEQQIQQETPSKAVEEDKNAMIEENPTPFFKPLQPSSPKSQGKFEPQAVKQEDPIVEEKEVMPKEAYLEQTKGQEEEKKAPVPPGNQTNAQAGQTILDFRNNRFFGMINGFLTFLTRRKKAYTGRSASAMYYDEKKKRYVIEGEEDSDEDVPPPPPPKKDTKKMEEEKQPQKEESAADALSKPAFSGALANRGRGRGRGAPMQNRFPQTFNTGQLAQSSFAPKPEVDEPKTQFQVSEQLEKFQNAEEEKKGEDPQAERLIEENSELYQSVRDISLNQTQYFDTAQNLPPSTQVPETVFEEEEAQNTSHILQNSFLIPNTNDPVRESEWQDKFSQQQDKINNLKYKVQMLQQELRNERDQNEQTIENFTVLCQDLKFKGMDEVEDLQQDIAIMKEQMKTMAHERAQQDVKLQSVTEISRYLEQENDCLQLELRQIKFTSIQQKIEREIIMIQESASQVADQSSGNQADDEDLQPSQSNDQLKAQVLDLQIEIDNMKWRTAVLEAEKLSKTLDARDISTQLDRIRSQLQSSESENNRLQDEIVRIQQEQAQFGQEQVQKLEREKEAIREMMQRIQGEKDRMNDQYRERATEYEGRIKKLEAERQRMDLEHSRAIREKEGTLDQARNQNLSLNQTINQSNEEIKMLQQQIKDLQIKIASLNAKRQSESEQAEQILKIQLRQAQDMLQQRSALADELASKQEEMNQELLQMDAMRHKMTENIVYLQNEIRKRDDLLENSSEFGGDFELIGEDAYDDDSSLIGANDEDFSGAGENSQREAMHGQLGASSQKQSFQMVRKNTIKRRTQYQAMLNQLEETRLQLKNQIEDKLITQRRIQNVEHTFRKLIEGLVDINKILDTQKQQFLEQSSSSTLMMMEGEQSNMIATSTNLEIELEGILDGTLQLTAEVLENLQPDESVHNVIGKIFSLQRGYESELSELKHKLKMQQMRIEEGESLRFDIEILQDEKNMLETELAQHRSALKSLEIKYADLNKALIETKTHDENVLRQVKEGYERMLLKERGENEQVLQTQRSETQRQIDEIHETFKSQMIPSIKKKYQAKYEELQSQLTELKDSLTSKIDEERAHSEQLEQQNRVLLAQSQKQLTDATEDTERLGEQLRYLELANQQLSNTNLQQRSSYETQITNLQSEISTLRLDCDELRDQHGREVEKMVSDFDEIARRLKEKYEQKSQQLKEMKGRTKELLQEEVAKREEVNDKLRKAEKKLAEALEQIASIQAKKDTEFATERSNLQQRAEQAETQVQELREQVSILEVQVSEVTQSIIQPPPLEEAKEDASKQIEQLQSQLDQLLLKNSELQAEFQTKQGELDENKSQFQLLAQSNEQQLLDYQQRENSLQKELESLWEQVKVLQKENASLQSEDQQFDQQQAKDIQDLQSQLAVQKEQMNLELTAKTQELAQIQEEYRQREEDFKSKFKEVIKDLKDKAKTQKELARQEQERANSMMAQLNQYESSSKQEAEGNEKLVQELREQNEVTLTDKRRLEQQIRELKEQHMQAKEKVELEHEEQVAKVRKEAQSHKEQLAMLEEQVQPLQRQRDSLVEELNELRTESQDMQDQISDLLISIDIPMPIELNAGVIVGKLKELLNNYGEDKRQLRQLMEERETFKQQVQEESSIIMENKEGLAAVGKLEKKVKTLEEENSVMKSHFQIKIYSYAEEVSQLKSRLSRYEEVLDDDQQQTDQREPSEESKVQGESFAQKPTTQDPSQLPSFADSSQIQKPVDQSTIQQRSGIFSTFASFFLTDSELQH